MAPTTPEVAKCEEYDSDVSAVKPGSRVVEARRRAAASRAPPKSLDRYKAGSRDAASDSGYSSRTSGTQASNTSATVTAAPAPSPVKPPPRPSTAGPATSRSKPVIHRSDSQRKEQKPLPQSTSASKQAEHCGDPNCRDAGCVSYRKQKRRYTISQPSPTRHASQYPPAPAAYQQPVQQYQYQYAQLPQVVASPPIPTLVPQPRPRARSTSRTARPATYHEGYTYPNSASQQGPPPAASAYQNMYASYYLHGNAPPPQQVTYPQPTSYFGTTPPNPIAPMYPLASPTATSPTSPTYPAITGGLQHTYSARTANPHVGGYELPREKVAVGLTRGPSARQTSARVAMPGTFPSGEPESSESSESSSEYSEDDYEEDRRPRTRDARRPSSSSARRPSTHGRYATAPVVPTRSREPLRRNQRSDTGLDYVSSSDNVDSDRTARAVVDRRTNHVDARTNYTDSGRSSRRPSVSTTASSGRTKTTGLTSLSGSGKMVVEGRNGRHTAYLSKEKLLRRMQQQKMDEQQSLMEKVAAYQNSVNGPQVPELTIEDIRKLQSRQIGGGSHASAHSSGRRSNSHHSSKPGNAEGIKIQSGATVLHVYGEAKIEMRPPGEDGSPAHLYIAGPTSGRDSTYHSSSKSGGSGGMTRSRRDSSEFWGGGSRHSQQHNNRRRDVIPEDVLGYEDEV